MTLGCTMCERNSIIAADTLISQRDDTVIYNWHDTLTMCLKVNICTCLQLLSDCVKQWYCEDADWTEDIIYYKFRSNKMAWWNKELFENAPPYMIIRPYLQEGLYISSGQISKLIVKLTYIHLQFLTKPHEYYDKSV